MSAGTGSIIVISGPSGAGKNTVYDEIKKKSDRIVQTVSVTTRAPRLNEKDGVDYYFVTEEQFRKLIDNNEFIEYVQYGKNYYGTLKSEVERLASDGNIVILVIEVEGAKRIREAFPESKSVFLVPSSVEELERRIRLRGENTEEELQTRIEIAISEMSLMDEYDYCVYNDDLDTCVDEVYNIINNITKG